MNGKQLLRRSLGALSSCHGPLFANHIVKMLSGFRRVPVLIIVVALVNTVAISACAEIDETAKNLGIVENLYQAFANGTVKDITSLMDEDVEWLVAGPATIPFAGSYCGKSEVERFFSNAISQIEVVEQTIDRYIPSGNTVAVLIYEHMRVKSTGKEYRTNAVHLYVLENEKIVRFEEFVDTAAQVVAFATLPDQLGEISVPPRPCKAP